jgi:hypothetical protein
MNETKKKKKRSGERMEKKQQQCSALIEKLNLSGFFCLPPFSLRFLSLTIINMPTQGYKND